MHLIKLNFLKFTSATAKKTNVIFEKQDKTKNLQSNLFNFFLNSKV